MSTENRKIFQARLIEALSVSGLKPSELALKLETRPSTVQSWTDGSNAPRPITLFKVAQILNVSAQWLIGEADEKGEFQAQGSEALADPPWNDGEKEALEISGAVLFKARLVMKKEGFSTLGDLVEHLIRIRHEKHVEL